MSAAGDRLPLPRQRAHPLAGLARVLLCHARLLVYGSCTLIALVTSYHLGKEMAWDTLDYHLYAGFSALHDRFGQDYFPAGPQAYLNPYVYVPFYLLVNSGLTELQVASVIAIVQSVILWLTYELALEVVPPDRPRWRLGLAVCAVVLAFANPILINQLGGSFADVITGELVLGGWLLLAGAVRAPGRMRILAAAALLGCAGALKLTNAVHALPAGLMVLFLPLDWRRRWRFAALFALAGGLSFLAVSAPWAWRLEQYFGNPVFPLFNGIFHSPEFTTAPIVDYRFIPVSLGAALRLPFAMIAPLSMIDVEYAAPDLRYALVLVAAAVLLLSWAWRRARTPGSQRAMRPRDASARALAALGSAFAADWLMWLTASGNGRYFIPMGCVAAVLAVALLFRLCGEHPKLRNYLLAVVLCVQFYQLLFGTEYPGRVPWARAPWFQVEVPRTLATQPALYFNYGVQSNSFLAPYLSRGSGLINLDGGYTLGSTGPNGRRIESLIRRYAPHWRVLMRDVQLQAARNSRTPDLSNLDDALMPFGLKVDTSHCGRILVGGIPPPLILMTTADAAPRRPPPPTTKGYFLSCRVVRGPKPGPELAASERAANLALDHLEEACPALLQPAHPVTYLLGDRKHGYVWARQYINTDISAWVRGGQVYFQRLIGADQQGHAGPERAWEQAPLPVVCGRSDGYFLRVVRHP